MRTATNLPETVQTLDRVRIPMADGAELAARIWLPQSAWNTPVPAILEYIPYRLRDGTAERDAVTHPWFAGHGYAAVRVDLRGSGDSDGLLRDEYLQQELDDGLEVLRWLAAQPWCDGRIGMYGISWGGFNGLQLAALQPPELRAVVSVASTDDRYADDVHHMGGCLLGDNLSWASTMFAFNSLPPDPAVVGERWRSLWLERLEHCTPWLEGWLRHQRRDGYWRHGSVCEDFAAIRAPVLAVSGWADGYSNAVFRLLRGLETPCHGLVGPWSHTYPHLGTPGPAIGFLQECLRWWDRWLKDADNGIDREPALRVWMQDSVPPTASYPERPGRWVAEAAWPSPHVHVEPWGLGSEGRLLPPGAEAGDGIAEITSPLVVGLFAGKWCSYAAGPDLAHDQRQEDGGALVFDGPRLEQPLEILGAPELELELAADRPQAMIAVRLSDVGTDDAATRVSYGLLNLSHRESSAEPEPLEPGRFHRVRVRLNEVAQHFPAGHRLRVSVSTSYWPLAWPSPEPARLRSRTAGSRLHVPVRPPREEDAALRPFDPPEGTPAPAVTQLEEAHHDWRVIRELAEDRSTLEVVNDSGRYRLEDTGTVVTSRAREWYRSRANDHDSVEGETRWERAFEREGWNVRTVTRTHLASDRTHFHLNADLDAFEDGERVFCRTFRYSIPRDGV
jgi:putative CocE/NonD family hydrolase